MNAVLDPAVDRSRNLMEAIEEEAEAWRGKLSAFRNLYAFLSQIIPYQDSDLERLYTFVRHLSPKLPKRSGGPGYDLMRKLGCSITGCRRSARAPSASAAWMAARSMVRRKSAAVRSMSCPCLYHGLLT